MKANLEIEYRLLLSEIRDFCSAHYHKSLKIKRSPVLIDAAGSCIGLVYYLAEICSWRETIRHQCRVKRSLFTIDDDIAGGVIRYCIIDKAIEIREFITRKLQKFTDKHNLFLAYSSDPSLREF